MQKNEGAAWSAVAPLNRQAIADKRAQPVGAHPKLDSARDSLSCYTILGLVSSESLARESGEGLVES